MLKSDMKPLKTCPICSGKRIHKVRRTFSQVIAGRKIRIPNVECYECPDCGEHIYDPAAADKVLSLPVTSRKASA
jgi:YgiT-type zinc finger domain-containing protein